MHESRFELVVVVESPWFDHVTPWPWPVASIPAFQRFRIHGGMTDEETGLLVAALTDPLQLDPGHSTAEILGQLSALDYFTLPGGLAVSDANDLVVIPGCCSGLEDWRDLWSIQERQSPWMGHDPTPWCQFFPGGVVRFWSDGGYGQGEIGRHADMTIGDVIASLERVHADLRAVVCRLRNWCDRVGFANAESVLAKFDRSFAISTNQPAYLEAE